VADGIVVEALHNRGVRDSAFHSSVMVVVIACTLFTDYFLYGIFFPSGGALSGEVGRRGTARLALRRLRA
jgi:hypothetical protein